MARRIGRVWAAAGAVMGALVSAGGCASTSPEAAPAWYQEYLDSPEARDYPRLEDVPRETVANADEAHWSSEAAELLAAAKALKDHPRSAPAGAEDPAAFEAEARAEIEAARAAH